MRKKIPLEILSRLVAVVAIILSAVAVLISVHPADAVSTDVESKSIDLTSKMDVFSNNVASNALSNLTYINIPKIYLLDEDALCGNTPDPSCSGSSKDPSVVRAVVDSAADLLGGQELSWNENLPFAKGEPISWYLDDTILVLNWAEKQDNGPLYYFSEIKLAHASQFRRMLSDNTYGSGNEYSCLELAKRSNAVLASNADFYIHRSSGINVYAGKLYRCKEGLDNCFVDNKGNLLLTSRDDPMTEAEVTSFIDEHHIRFSISFGPNLVKNGKLIDTSSYPIGELTHNCIRSALGQLGELHYLILFSSRTNITPIGPKMLEMGCYTAYGLDGGQTAETVFLGKPQTPWFFGSQRQVSDIIYFATAYPFEGETQ